MHCLYNLLGCIIFSFGDCVELAGKPLGVSQNDNYVISKGKLFRGGVAQREHDKCGCETEAREKALAYSYCWAVGGILSGLNLCTHCVHF